MVVESVMLVISLISHLPSTKRDPVTFITCTGPGIGISMGCRLAEWVTFLHMAVMAAVVMCRIRNPACTAASALGKERHVNG